MAGRGFSVLSAGVAVATVLSFAAVGVSAVVSPAAASPAGPVRLPIAAGSPRAAALSVPVDPALVALDRAGGTPAGGYVAARGAYQPSGSAAPGLRCRWVQDKYSQ